MKEFSIKIIKNVSLAILLMAGAAFAACSSDDSIAEQQPVNPTEQTYTMTVQATKSDAQTRGLILDGQNLNVKWNEGEEVYVVQQEDNDPYGYYVLGKLTATPDTEDQTKATLTGTLTIAPTHKRDIVFYLHSANSDYRGQTGVLLSDAKSIEKKYDYAMATVHWDNWDEFTVDEENKTVSVPGGLSFKSTQAIVKFILKDKEGNAIKAKSLTISGFRHPGTIDVDNICLYHPYNASNDEEGPLTITPATPTSEIYAAIRTMEIYPMLFTLTVIDENDVRYTYEKTDVKFTNGKYYSISVKMNDTRVNLSTLTENYVAKDGDILMGNLNNKIKVSIADGATVTFRNLTIEGEKSQFTNEPYNWAGITCEGNATIVLEGNNTAKGFDDVYPGIYVPTGKTLTITGDGSLTASSNGYGAGIGAGNNMACGNIVIEGGTITANGGVGCAGIGCAGSGNCGNITIKGGTIEATGQQSAPGIGAGDQAQCGNITIENTVDMVTATAGNMAYYSIGVSASGGTCGTITIGGTQYYDGSVYASEELQNALKASPFIYKPIKTLSTATTADLGKVVCAQGHLHDAKTAVPEGCTAVGILGKVTGKGKGLILALQDATSQQWTTIVGWTSVTTYAGTTLKVLPDKAARGSLTSYTSLGGITVSNWAVAQQDDYEAIFTNLGSKAGDETAGIRFDANVNAYMTTNVGGDELYTGSNGYWTATEAKNDWACFFSSDSWGSSAKDHTKWVRPVLGF